MYEVHISGELITCAQDPNFGFASAGLGKEGCEDKCNKDTKCGFYFFTDNNYCTLYSACDQTRIPGSNGTTYRKVGGKCFIFIIDINIFINIIIKSLLLELHLITLKIIG